jgi:iron complex transport system ATP-binding protein
VLHGVSLAPPPGAVTAVLGPNGAGKSTLLRVLLGAAAPHRGRVTLDGAPIASLRAGQRASRVAYVSQRPGVSAPMTVDHAVRLGRYARPGTRADSDRAVARALERVGLAAHAQRPIAELSAGQQQRAAMARALAQLDGTPAAQRVLLADEPAAFLDPAHALLALELCAHLAGEGATVVVVLHDLSLALRWCAHALLLRADGRVAASGPAADVLAPQVLEGVYGVSFAHATSAQGHRALIATRANC